MDQTQICANCQKENPITNMFCQNCGARLSGPQTEPPPPTQSVVLAPLPPLPPAGFPPPAVSTFGSVQPLEAPPPAPPAYPPPPPSMATPQPLYPQPAPVYAPPPLPAQSFGLFRARIDSWVDLVEGSAGLAGAMETALDDELKTLDIPFSTVSTSELGAGSQRRKYHLITNKAGSTVAIYVGAFGKDLSLKWDLYQRRTLRIIPIVVLLGICAFLSLVNAVGNVNFFFFLRSLFMGFFGWIMPVLVVALVAGKILLNDFWGFLVETDSTADGDAEALTIAVQRAIGRAFEKCGGDPSELYPL